MSNLKNEGDRVYKVYHHMGKGMFTWDSDYVFNTVRAYFYKAVRGDFGYWIKAGDRIITNSGNIEGFVRKSSKGETFVFKINSISLKSGHITISYTT